MKSQSGLAPKIINIIPGLLLVQMCHMSHVQIVCLSSLEEKKNITG